ncbi:Gfo/Idh/MocA family protein [Demetria terragena]|uniref:Gfo/Idh/MocA family protein n=1 Tax=Demetria terragena TaxID=63959 RepID=UPI000361DFA9|nr:Gfo/Idh/MocA family oxidoreductase [Demetria terragena]
MTTPVRIGLVGTGYHARRVHAPLHSGDGPTRLAGIWGRDPHKTAAIAADFGVPACASLDELFERCEAVDFAVPPDVQAQVAVQAAEAGKALMLEKPLGLTLAEAERVAGAVRTAGVPAIVAMAKRFHPRTEEFIAAAAELRASSRVLGLTARFFHSGFLPGGSIGADTWRLAEHGALRDLGPHLLDLVELAAGPITAVRFEPADGAYCAVTTRHESGVVGQVAMSGAIRIDRPLTDVEVYSDGGHLHFNAAEIEHQHTWNRIRDEFAATVRTGSSVTVDVDRALQMSQVIDAIERSAREGNQIEVNG